MPEPPENIDASELWLALTTLPRPYRIVDMPRYLPGSNEPVGQLAIWPLTQEEQMACNAEADRFTKELLKDPQQKDQANLGYHHTFANETAVQVLSRACRDAKNVQRPAFPSPKMLRRTLTSDEVGVLFNSYLTVQSEVGPIVAYMTKDEMDAWVRRIGEGGSLFPLDVLSSEMRDQLVRHMASSLIACWTATTSAGSPPAASSMTSELAEPSPNLPDHDAP